jgi:uroporphyrinogen decarboxylase
MSLTPMQRVLTSLRHEEPDRVPFFLPLTVHGARELGLSIRDYFSSAEQVIEGQLRMQARYSHDLLYGLFYAAVEAEAFGAETIFFDDGPPNAGAPVLRSVGQTPPSPPVVEDCPSLVRVLETIAGLKRRVGDTIPIVGVVISPFSLPVMLMGFGPYLELLTHDRPAFFRLMATTEEFCVRWANAQLRAGATVICYFDPLASTTVTDRATYLETGHVVACRTLARIEGPTMTHLASGRGLPVIDALAATGTAGVGVSVLEDLAEVKRACGRRLTIVGNLNALEMRRWTDDVTEQHVRDAIERGAAGGGFILSDNHGEIPWQVPESVLDALSAAVHRWGTYPPSLSSASA